MPLRNGNGLAPFTPLLSSMTNSSGVATFTVPAGTLRRYDGCLPVVAAPTSSGRYSAQVASEPVIGSRPDPATALTITVAVSASNTTGVLLGGYVSGLAAAGSGVVVRLMLAGV